MSFIDDRLETLIAVCDAKSFTKAADNLGLTQPAVSQHIKRLEDELQTSLFLRKKGEMVLSAEGEIAVLYAKRLRAMESKMLSKIKNAQSNVRKIRIGITHTQESSVMIEVLSKLTGKEDNLNITFITDNIKNLYDMLENFEIDMAIIEGKPTNPDFNFVVLDADPLLCVMSPQNPLSSGAAITLAQLKSQQLILRLPSSSTREKFESSLLSIGESIVSFNVTIEVDSIATIRSLVKKNFGVSILSKKVCIKDVNKHSLVALPIENLSMIRETTIAYHKTYTHPEIVSRIAQVYNALVLPQ